MRQSYRPMDTNIVRDRIVPVGGMNSFYFGPSSPLARTVSHFMRNREENSVVE